MNAYDFWAEQALPVETKKVRACLGCNAEIFGTVHQRLCNACRASAHAKQSGMSPTRYGVHNTPKQKAMPCE